MRSELYVDELVGNKIEVVTSCRIPNCIEFGTINSTKHYLDLLNIFCYCVSSLYAIAPMAVNDRKNNTAPNPTIAAPSMLSLITS